jgi:hypothetical protein
MNTTEASFILSVAFGVSAAILAVAAVLLFIRYRRFASEVQQLSTKYRLAHLKAGKLERELARYGVIPDAEAERRRNMEEYRQQEAAHVARMQEFSAAYEERLKAHVTIESAIQQAKQELAELTDPLDLRSFGYYENHYDFDAPERYKGQLDGVRFEQKRILRARIAAHCDIPWTVNGSEAAGRKQTEQYLKLMVRSFNSEADVCIAKVKYNNVLVMEQRIKKAHDQINKLGSVQRCYINPDYLNLKLQELYLVHEYREKLEQKKEEQREIRARMRDDEIARREIAKALEEADRDKELYTRALEDAKAEVAIATGARHQKLLDHIGNLERKLSEALTLKERALSRAQLTRSGHVYVVSNLGSFGEDVYKIGMTRRLNPFDRVVELGDASVPFRFDLHAIIYCDDAPSLESQLHAKFADRRINRINHRKEFFRVSLEEIADAVRAFHGEIDFITEAEAEEFRKTLAFLEAGCPLTPTIALTEPIDISEIVE